MENRCVRVYRDRHGRLGDPCDCRALQHIITHSPWDATRVWNRLRAMVAVRTGILALDIPGP